MQVLIRGGRLVNPGYQAGLKDILIADGLVKRVADPGQVETISADSALRIIDAGGKIVAPGFIDMHVHLREPGQEYKETIASGGRAAIHGGFTAVCAMPNTDPVNDNPETTALIRRRAAAVKAAKIYPVAAVSIGSQGSRLSRFSDLKQAGAVGVSDDGRPVAGSRMMREALEAAKNAGLPVISHAEDLDLAGSGVMNEGPVAKQLGLPGIPNAAESIMVMRDIALCALTGGALHIAHVSTRESIQAIRDAKQRGLPVTAETAPHYFCLTDEAVVKSGTQAKMNPPLRSEQDRLAVMEGLADGTIDAIATDHAPHAVSEKQVPFEKAANGIIGLETAVGLSLKLVRDKILSLETLVAKLSTRPAGILGLPQGLHEGAAADITILDLDREYRVDVNRFQSLGRNTPFDGWDLTGCAVLTMVDGNIVYDAVS